MTPDFLEAVREAQYRQCRATRADFAAFGAMRREKKAALGIAPDDRRHAVIRSASAREARRMLDLAMEAAADLAGLPLGFLMGFESSGRSTPMERKALQRAYEARGLAFRRDGAVAWA